MGAVEPEGERTMSKESFGSTVEALAGTLTGILYEELQRVLSWLQPHFCRIETRTCVEEFLRALMSRAEHKNCWQLSEEAGRVDPYGFQYLLGRARWDEKAVRDSLQTHVLQNFGNGGNCIIDETGFIKKGIMSAGVARQYSGTAGKIENCQVGVFLVYAQGEERTFIDYELFLPEKWTQDRERCRKAGIPDEVEFATKPVLAERMLARAFETGYKPQWVLGDEVYGRSSRLREFLERRNQHYVLAIASNTPVSRGFSQTTPNAVLSQLQPWDWQRLSAGSGEKGPRIYDWSLVGLNSDVWSQSRWLLFRRNIADPTDVGFFLVHAPEETSLKEIVEAAGSRWPVESCFESSKQEVGLDDYEVRSWTGWYRHIVLCSIAHAFLAASRMRLNAQENIDRPATKEPQERPDAPVAKWGKTAASKESESHTGFDDKQKPSAQRQRHEQDSGRMVTLLPKVIGPPCKSSSMLAFLHRRGLCLSNSASRR